MCSRSAGNASPPAGSITMAPYIPVCSWKPECEWYQ